MRWLWLVAGSVALLGCSKAQDMQAVHKEQLATYDVVLTSYSVMEASFRKQEIGFKRKKEVVKEKSALHAVPWHRVVLDEVRKARRPRRSPHSDHTLSSSRAHTQAHNIKDRATNTAKAAFELKSTYR